MNECLPKFVCVKSNSYSDNTKRQNEIQNSNSNGVKASLSESQPETYKKTELLNSSVASFMITSNQHNFQYTPKEDLTNHENELKVNEDNEDEEEDLNKTLTDDDVTINSIQPHSAEENIHATESNQNNETHNNKIEVENDLYYSDREELNISSEESIINNEKEDFKNDKFNHFNLGRWQPEEHHKFIQAMYMYGNEWKKVQEYIGSRSSTQARSHAQKFFIRLKKRFSSENNSNDQESLQKKSENILMWIKESIPNEIIENNLKENEKEENSNKFCKVIMNLMSGQIEAKGRKRRHKSKSNLSEAYQFGEKKRNYNLYGMSRRESTSGVRHMTKDLNNPYNLAYTNNNSGRLRDDYQFNNNLRLNKKIKIPLMIDEIMSENNNCNYNGDHSNDNYPENFKGQSDTTQENRIFNIVKDVKKMELKMKKKSKMNTSNFSQASSSSYKLEQDQDFVEEIVKKSKISNTSNVINKQVFNPKHRHYINIVNISIDNNNNNINNNISSGSRAANSNSNSKVNNSNLNINRDQMHFNKTINRNLKKDESINIKPDNNSIGSGNTINTINSNPNNFNSHLMNSFNNFNNSSHNVNCTNSIQISEKEVVKNLIQQKVLYQILMNNQARSHINLLNSLSPNSFNSLAANSGNNYNLQSFGSTAPTNSFDNLNVPNPGASGINSNCQIPQYNNQYQTLGSCNNIFEANSSSKVNNNIFDINFEEESNLFKLYGREEDYKSTNIYVNPVNDNYQIIKKEDSVKGECNIDFDLDQYFKSD
jgi:SHAQKYF class myb-like DNA-binding protein